MSGTVFKPKNREGGKEMRDEIIYQPPGDASVPCRKCEVNLAVFLPAVQVYCLSDALRCFPGLPHFFQCHSLVEPCIRMAGIILQRVVIGSNRRLVLAKTILAIAEQHVSLRVPGIRVNGFIQIIDRRSVISHQSHFPGLPDQVLCLRKGAVKPLRFRFSFLLVTCSTLNHHVTEF